MNLYDQAIKDLQRFTSGEFSVDMVFVAPTMETATIKGWTTQHHTQFDSEGNLINAKTAPITISEKFLIDAGYPVRNASGEVAMLNHLVTVQNSTYNNRQFKIVQNLPDERLGAITFILSEFE